MGNERADAGNVGAVAARYVSGGDLYISALSRSGTAYDLYRSTDLGGTWQKTGTSARGPNFLRYLGGGGVLSETVLSLDATAHWIDVSVAGAQAAGLRRDAAPNGGGKVISVYEQQVPVSADAPRGSQALLARSSDHGATWAPGIAIPGLEKRLRTPAWMGDGHYVAMGRRYVRSGPCSLGQCDFYEPMLYASASSGASWQSAAQIDLDHLVHLGRHILADGRLVADPAGDPVLLANRYLPAEDDRQEFVRSIDGGATWEPVGFPAEMQYGAPDYYALWQLTSVGNGVVLAYFHDTAATNRHALYKSLDAGQTWQRVGDLPTGTDDPGVFGMAFIPLNRTLPGIALASQ